MRLEDAHRYLQAAERKMLAARRLLEGPIDGRVAHEWLAATQAEQEAREAALGAAGAAPIPRSANPSERA